jgi:hypothetical protein
MLPFLGMAKTVGMGFKPNAVKIKKKWSPKLALEKSLGQPKQALDSIKRA